MNEKKLNLTQNKCITSLCGTSTKLKQNQPVSKKHPAELQIWKKKNVLICDDLNKDLLGFNEM